MQHASAAETRTLLFVYGTLKRGKPLHDILANDSYFLGPVAAEGFALYTNHGFYPFLSPHLGGFVQGELYAVTDDTHERCREVELSAGYSEVIVDVIDEQGVHAPAYAYLGNVQWRKSAIHIGEEWEAW